MLFILHLKKQSFTLQIDFLCKIIPRQIKAESAVNIIRNTVEELIMKCKENCRLPIYEDVKELKYLISLLETIRLNLVKI